MELALLAGLAAVATSSLLGVRNGLYGLYAFGAYALMMLALLMLPETRGRSLDAIGTATR